MRLFQRQIIALAVLLISFFSISAAQGATEPVSPNLDILRQMIKSSRNINTLKFRLKKKERVNGEMRQQLTDIKMTKSPYRVYMRQSMPKEGMEVLYVTGWNDNKALINTNGFPWVNVSLDPYGDKMREDQHHTVFSCGFEMTMDILEHLLDKYSNEADQMVSLLGTSNWHGRNCYQFELNNPHFRMETYTTKAGESVESIARDRQVNGYMILDRNPGISTYESLPTGTKLKVPNDYAKKMVVYVEKDRLIPAFIKVYDEKGLYEQYEYLLVDVNPKIPLSEFSSDHPDYGF